MVSHAIVGSEFGGRAGGVKQTEVFGAVGCCGVRKVK